MGVIHKGKFEIDCEKIVLFVNFTMEGKKEEYSQLAFGNKDKVITGA